MRSTKHVEDLYLESDQAIKNGNFLEAKNLLETILSEEPNYSQAHNSLGWLYRTQFDDYETAENHFLAAIRFCPEYPHPYWNYVYLLTDTERFGELEKLLQQCLKVPMVNKAQVHSQFGLMHEYKEQYTKAITSYETAVRLSVHDEKIEEYRRSISRCRSKQGMQTPEVAPILTPAEFPKKSWFKGRK
jgi:tetratricopeptide (TPR) repeat protein